MRVDSSACAAVSKNPTEVMDAIAGVDERVAVEARELAQLGEEVLVDLLEDLALAALVDRLVASNGDMHRCSFLEGGGLSVDPPVRSTRE
jgi:hypothetical protein